MNFNTFILSISTTFFLCVCLRETIKKVATKEMQTGGGCTSRLLSAQYDA